MMEILHAESIDLVALELKLRDEDGLQLARRLREASRIPIIILTSIAEEADRVMALELGADDYVTKPFSSRELLARIRAVMRRYRAMQSVVAQENEIRAYRFAGGHSTYACTGSLPRPVNAFRSPTVNSVCWSPSWVTPSVF